MVTLKESETQHRRSKTGCDAPDAPPDAGLCELAILCVSKLEIYGGAFLLTFGLFMLSLAEPNQFYQVIC